MVAACPRKVPTPKRLITGIASIKGRLLYGIGMFAHGSLQLYKTVYHLLLTIIKYIYFILSNVLTF